MGERREDIAIHSFTSWFRGSLLDFPIACNLALNLSFDSAWSKEAMVAYMSSSVFIRLNVPIFLKYPLHFPEIKFVDDLNKLYMSVF